mgnify:CR=1 FL=1
MTSSVLGGRLRGPANLGAETRLIACDQIMAINGSSAMDQTACKLVPVPAQKLPEFNLSPQVRGRKRAACVSRPVYRLHNLYTGRPVTHQAACVPTSSEISS